MRTMPEGNMTQALIRTQLQNKVHVVYDAQKRHKKEIKQKLLRMAGLNEELQLKEVKDPKLITKLLEMEHKEVQQRMQYKFGVLYLLDGQNEDEMFNNTDDCVSSDYREFLDFLGEQVALEGFSRYGGGLDTKSNTTGTHSRYTRYRGMDIMFHVSTLLPHNPNDPQQLERKRHLGNDVVLIIFKEGGETPFNPTSIHSHFNYIFAVVTKVPPTCPNDVNTYYKLNIASKHGVRPFPPYLPRPPVFKK